MAGPDMGFLELINAVLPYIGMAVVAIVSLVGFWYYRYKYQPEIARDLTKAHHSKGLPVFIQDEMGNVNFECCDKKFPEGVVHTKRKGWFLLPAPPSPEEETESNREIVKRGPGRPSKEEYRSAEQLAVMTEEEKERYVERFGKMIQAPILRGLGKQVFFGSATAAALSNLWAIAHANLPDVRNLSPKMYQKTQLDALATGNRIEGLKMSRAETTKLLMYAIIAVIPIAALGIIAWLLTQHPQGTQVLLGLI